VHWKHAFDEGAPRISEYLPALHLSQIAVLTFVEYVPFPQAVQTVKPVSEKFPAPQIEHVLDASALENSPF